MRLMFLLALVFVVRYFTPSGDFVGASVSYDWTAEDCAQHKIESDAEPDPDGLTTVSACVDDSELPHLLGARETDI